MDLYQILGVQRDATVEEIRAAFRALAKKAHPDVGGSEELFLQLQLAHDTLIDAETRNEYDKTGRIKKQKTEDDAVFQEAMKAINQMVMQVLQLKDDQILVDPIEAFLEAIADQKKKVLEAEAALIKLIAKAEKLVKRWHRKTAGQPNLIVKMIESYIRNQQDKLPILANDLKIIAKAVEIVSDYTFDVDTVMPSTPPTPYTRTVPTLAETMMREMMRLERKGGKR